MSHHLAKLLSPTELMQLHRQVAETIGQQFDILSVQRGTGGVVVTIKIPTGGTRTIKLEESNG